MEFIEGSRGIYRPIRVLFDTPIYDRALQLCWNINSYNSQIALLRELLMLQEAYQIPSQVTAEDMIHFLMEESKSTLRERLWEFELEDFDEEDAKPLLMLVWAVNISNKMRDIEFEAQMLRNSSEPLPPKFLHPKVLSMATEYAKTLRTKQEAPSSKLLSPQEVVLEVVPRVLQGFWKLPHRPLLNMPSQKLSKMSVGVTKAVLDRVTDALTGVEGQTTFSRSIRDDVVLSILTQIRQTHPLDVLVNRIKSFAPVLLSEIVDVAAEQICQMFQPQSPKVPAHLSPAAEPPATAPVQEDLTLTVTPSPETNSAVVSPPPASPTPPAEPPSTTDVETREDECDTSCTENDPEPTRDPDSAAVPPAVTPPVEPPSITDVETRKDESDTSCTENDPEPTRDPDSAVVPQIVTPPAEPPSVTDVETSKDINDEPNLENDPEPTKEPDTAPVPAVLSPPAEPPCIPDVLTRENENDQPCLNENLKPTREPDSAVSPAPLAPLAPPAEPQIITAVPALTFRPETNSAEVSPGEPPHITEVQDREDTSIEEGSEPTREPVSVHPASWSPRTPPLEPVVIVSVIEVKEKRAQGVFSWLAQPFCCFGVSDTLTELLSLTIK